MKSRIIFIPLFALLLTGCDQAHKINQSTCDINRNTDAIIKSTEAINRNLVELEKIRAGRG